MRWEDERWVKVYTRDTPSWLSLSFEAQSLLLLLFRKVDRAGLLPLGPLGRRGVAVVIGHGPRWAQLESALDELIASGTVAIRETVLVVPNFLEAQETPASGAQRARECRARARDVCNAESRNVTITERNVTQESQNVTEPSRSVTSRNVLQRLVTPRRDETRVDESRRDEETFDASQNVTPEKPKKNGTDPRFAPLRLAWEQTFAQVTREPYRWQGPKDAKAVHSLIAIEVDEFRARADRGLRAQGFAHCSTVAMLASKWNELAGQQTPQRNNGNGRAKDPSGPHFIPPAPVAPASGLPEWDAILAHYAEVGPGTRYYLGKEVVPSIDKGTLRLTVPDRFRANYLRRHLADITALCKMPVEIAVIDNSPLDVATAP